MLAFSKLVHMQPTIPINRVSRVNRVWSAVMPMEVQAQLSQLLQLVKRSFSCLAHHRWQWQGEEDIFLSLILYGELGDARLAQDNSENMYVGHRASNDSSFVPVYLLTRMCLIIEKIRIIHRRMSYEQLTTSRCECDTLYKQLCGHQLENQWIWNQQSLADLKITFQFC